MGVVADSNAILWYVQGSTRLSDAAKSGLGDAEANDGIVVSVATLVDLWYVTQTTAGVSAEDLARLTDPWDRFIVATARTGDPTHYRDEAIREAQLVETIW